MRSEEQVRTENIQSYPNRVECNICGAKTEGLVEVRFIDYAVYFLCPDCALLIGDSAKQWRTPR